MAGVVGRNSSLFAPLRPHPSRIAILWSLTGTPDSAMNAYQALFDTNIQVDFVHPGELVSGTAPYVVLYVPNPAGATPATAAALSAFATGGGTLIIERSSNPSTHTLDDLFDRDARPWTNDAVPNNESARGSRRKRRGISCAGGGSWKRTRVPACHLPPRRRDRRWRVRGR